MKYSVTRITSSNHCPSDHKDFLGDVRKAPEVMCEEQLQTFLVEWLPIYLAQGYVVEIKVHERRLASYNYAI